MTRSANDVVITGIGLVTANGVGRAAHEALLTALSAPVPAVDTDRFAPYPVHPLPPIDWSEQIPRRGDQRQMENWQRLGVFAAGLALDDAGLKDDAEACATMDMIVAAGGGERDIAVDSAIVEEAERRNDPEKLLNEKLTTELRPTLFLAQLSNLLAGNISIVHKVTGSSRTFMGEEAAGISALETAYARIRAGQSTHALIGGAFNAERPDILLLIESLAGLATGGWAPLWSRRPEDGGGVIQGSAGVFLVLESRKRAEARGAAIYAVVKGVEGDRGSRDEGRMEERMRRLAAGIGAAEAAAPLVMSAASGLIDLAARERALLSALFPSGSLRGFTGVTGHAIESQFLIGVALAAVALKRRALVPVFDANVERPMAEPATSAVVSCVGHVRGEGLAYLTADA